MTDNSRSFPQEKGQNGKRTTKHCTENSNPTKNQGVNSTALEYFFSTLS